eukprot:gene8477-9173_t
MSGSLERILKFYDDATNLLSNKLESNQRGGYESKVITEINRLRTWIQKHQDDVISESGKTKLFQTLELYYSSSLNIEKGFSDSFKDTVFNLLSDYLQLPEGKLLAAKDKKKVLSWTSKFVETGKAPANTSSVINISEWYVYSGDSDDNFQLMNSKNEEDWKEGVTTISKALQQELNTLLEEKGDSGDSVIVLYNEELNKIVAIKPNA